ncbi:C-factor [Tribolium madens]|uniref:C-factor n=1 Tax=Tribolium madens TaxID=41895 RepID=UPI001CF731CD|nr:C-factor [Tribolium madens]
MKSILVTGCNRGIGLGLIRHLVKEKNPPKHVIATCRSIEKAKDLQQIASENKNVHLLELDVRNYDEYDSFSKKVGNIVQTDGLNILFNNAGVSSKFTRVQLVKYDQMLEAFKVNTIGPVMLTKALLPLLKQAAKNNSDKPLGAQKALIVNTTSVLGSIALNSDGGFFPYRCSKAALNMATKSLSIDLQKDGILVTGIHPGWVKTDMGGSNAPIDVDTSVMGIFEVIRNVNETHNGGFYQYDGKQLEW